MEAGLHLNVFTVDFNEELVAFYGGSLLRQTHFLHECIKAVLRLYKVGAAVLIRSPVHRFWFQQVEPKLENIREHQKNLSEKMENPESRLADPAPSQKVI